MNAPPDLSQRAIDVPALRPIGPKKDNGRASAGYNSFCFSILDESIVTGRLVKPAFRTVRS